MTGITSEILRKVSEEILFLDRFKSFFMELPNFDFKDICQAIENLKEVDENVGYLTCAIDSCRFVYIDNPEKIRELGVNGALFYEILRQASQDLKKLTNNDLCLDYYIDLGKGGADVFFKRCRSESSYKKFEITAKEYLEGRKIPKKLKFVLDRIGIKLSQ